MTHTAIPKMTEPRNDAKKPRTVWIMLENFLTHIGFLYPGKPFKEVVDNVRIEDGGRRLVRLEENKVKKPKVFSFPPGMNNEIGIVTPMHINQAAGPADMLKSGRSILCNFHGIDKRNLDQVRFFLMGVVYAVGGTCKKINDTIYLLTPASMDVFDCQDEDPPDRKQRKVEIEDEEVLDKFFGT
jgi:hypothetical protein